MEIFQSRTLQDAFSGWNCDTYPPGTHPQYLLFHQTGFQHIAFYLPRELTVGVGGEPVGVSADAGGGLPGTAAAAHPAAAPGAARRLLRCPRRGAPSTGHNSLRRSPAATAPENGKIYVSRVSSGRRGRKK